MLDTSSDSEDSVGDDEQPVSMTKLTQFLTTPGSATAKAVGAG